MSIYWEQFDWPSFATLTTGLAAVGAAIYVGRKQTEIARRQAAISEKQTDILADQSAVAEMTYRNALFDRRYQVFEAVRDFLLAIIRESRRPENEVEQAFIRALLESRFLFRPSVHNALSDILKRAEEYVGLATPERRMYPEDAGVKPGEDRREQELWASFAADINRIHELFEELQLGDHSLRPAK